MPMDLLRRVNLVLELPRSARTTPDDLLALRSMSWDDLAEVRSLAVKHEYQGKGIGSKMVRNCIREARALCIKRVFVLTYQPDFFRKLRFRVTDKATLPQKIWGGCIRCPKFPECDEHALIRKV